MLELLRTRTSAVWAVLVVATLLSWYIATGPVDTPGSVWPSVVVLAVTFFKVRLVGLYFMELRDAPWSLRGLFEGYCVVGLCVLAGIVVFV